MTKCISKYLMIACCLIIAGGLVSTVSFASEEQPVIKIETLKPEMGAPTTDRRVSFLAHILGDGVEFTEDTVLWLDDEVVQAELTMEHDEYGNNTYTVFYVPDHNLSLGVHTYKLRVTYGGGHKVFQHSPFFVYVDGVFGGELAVSERRQANE